MAEDRKNQPPEGEPKSSGLDRRTFLQGVGAAGVVGAAGAAGLDRLAASPAPSVSPETIVAIEPRVRPAASIRNDVPRPAGLQPGAQLDCRWPQAYRETIPESVRLVTRFFEAWSEQDLGAMADVMHFPFAIVERTEPIPFQSRQEFLSNPPMTLAPADMEVNHPHHYTGRIAPGSYNLFQSVDVPLFCPVGSATTLTFFRYSESGHKLLEGDVLFACTNNDGRWGIELISTILTPVDHIGVPQEDVEMHALRTGQDSMLRYTNRHIPAPPPTNPPPFMGRRGSARVSFGYGPRARAGDARNNDPTAGWQISGVESRLSVSFTEPRDPDAPPPEPPTELDPENPRFTRSYNFDQFAEWAGGNVGTWGDTMTNAYQPRVLGNGRHAIMDKAHTMGGYIRHTPDLTMISETRSVSIRAYREGNWGSAGGISQVTYHDRSNSYPYVG